MSLKGVISCRFGRQAGGKKEPKLANWLACCFRIRNSLQKVEGKSQLPQTY